MGIFDMIKRAFDPRTPFRNIKNMNQSIGRGDFKGALKGSVLSGLGGVPGGQMFAPMAENAMNAAQNGNWRSLGESLVPGMGALNAFRGGDVRGGIGRMLNPMGEQAQAFSGMSAPRQPAPVAAGGWGPQGWGTSVPRGGVMGGPPQIGRQGPDPLFSGGQQPPQPAPTPQQQRPQMQQPMDANARFKLWRDQGIRL